MPLRSFKIILIGDARVGKTSIRKTYFGEGFKAQYLVTIGADFALKRLTNSLLRIWDLAGQSDYRRFRKNYYQGSHGCLLVFDLTNPTSLVNLELWLEELGEALDKQIPTIVIGNKSDLINDDHTIISHEEINDTLASLSEKFQVELDFIETSALTGDNINYAFEALIHTILY